MEDIYQSVFAFRPGTVKFEPRSCTGSFSVLQFVARVAQCDAIGTAAQHFTQKTRIGPGGVSALL